MPSRPRPRPSSPTTSSSCCIASTIHPCSTHSSTSTSPSSFRRKSRCRIRDIALLSLFLWSSPTRALKILLTNDDGLEKPGLQELRTALLEDGHEVYTYAPASDRSGLSASVSLAIPFIDLGDNQVVVNGPPASCVIAGLSIMEQGLMVADGQQQPIGTPDLVVIGISDGVATGPQTLHSSSVGAAIAALSKGIPAVTVGGLPPSEREVDYYADVANFTVRFIAEWTSTMPLSEIPTGYGIKIAYPGSFSYLVEGIRVAEHGRQAPISFGYVPSLENPNVYQIAPVVNSEEMDPESEAALVEAGYISILPISSRFYLPERDFNVRYILTLRRLIKNLYSKRNGV